MHLKSNKQRCDEMLGIRCSFIVIVYSLVVKKIDKNQLLTYMGYATMMKTFLKIKNEEQRQQIKYDVRKAFTNKLTELKAA
jgi:hypothetical protein